MGRKKQEEILRGSGNPVLELSFSWSPNIGSLKSAWPAPNLLKVCTIDIEVMETHWWLGRFGLWFLPSDDSVAD